MVRQIHREDGQFEVEEREYHNLYYALFIGDTCYGYAHLQLILSEHVGYCHVYINRFTPKIIREIKEDWTLLKDKMRTFGIKRVVGTKVDGIKLWTKFIKLLGFKEVVPATIEGKSCMMAIMEV